MRRLSLGDWVIFVQRLAEELAAAGSVQDVGACIAERVREGLGAAAVSVGVVGPDRTSIVTLATDGLSAPTVELLSRPIRLSENRPAMTAFAAGPVLWSSLAERDRDYPELAGFPSSMGSWAIVPLAVQGEPVGVLSIGWPHERRFHQVEVALLRVIGHLTAVAVERARIERLRRAERDVLELLSDGTRIMVSALDPAHVLESLVHLAVPRLAPWCAVYVVDGRTLHRVAIEIEGTTGLAAALRGQPAPSLDAPGPLAAAYRTGEVQVVSTVDSEQVRSIYASPHAERILARSGSWSGLVAPVKASGRVVGVMSLFSSEWGSVPPDEVRWGAVTLAARAGVALVNARRFEREREAVTTLMEAFLPSGLPTIDGYDLAARYLPAGSMVAGDWFDVLRLGSGEYLVGIGDAGGHGVRAASLMGQLRNAARGLAMRGHTPSEILHGLHLLTAAEGEDAYATASYALVDTAAHRVRWASAGHLPPLEYRDDGTVRYLPDPRNPPLSWGAGVAPEHVASMEPGSGLVLVTDGVVERRGRGLEEGMAALAGLVASCSSPSVDAEGLTDRIAEELCTGAEDDCCVMVVRRVAGVRGQGTKVAT